MLLLGLIYFLEKEGYEVRSNKESAYGRYDLVIILNNLDEIGYVIEKNLISM